MGNFEGNVCPNLRLPSRPVFAPVGRNQCHHVASASRNRDVTCRLHFCGHLCIFVTVYRFRVRAYFFPSVPYFCICNDCSQTALRQICRFGRTMTVDDQSEISFSVSQGTLSGNKFLLVLSTPLSSATELSFGDIRQVAVSSLSSGCLQRRRQTRRRPD